MLPDKMNAKDMTQEDWQKLRKASKVKADSINNKIHNEQGQIISQTPSEDHED